MAALRTAVVAATAFCLKQGVDLAAIEALPLGGMARLTAVANAVNALIAPEELRRDFLGHAQLVNILYRAVKPDPTALEFAERVAGIVTLAATIKAKLSPNPPDISTILQQINGLLDDSIAGLSIREEGPPAINLANIDFAALAQRFQESQHQNTELEALKSAIRAKLEMMVQLNHTRVNFLEKFEELINDYNAGSHSIELLFNELMKLATSLNEEEQRHLREHLREEELVIFDILTRPAPELSTAERQAVKKAARDLLERIKSELVLNWRQKSSARSKLQLVIEDTLDSNLPTAYSTELYQEKCTAIFQHIYESYPEAGSGVYAGLS